MDASLSNIDFEPLTLVKAKLSEKVAQVTKTGRLLTITVKGKPQAILIPYQQFLALVESRQYQPRLIRLSDWEKQSKERRSVSASIKNLFDISSLNRKGQKPYKRDALKKFGQSGQGKK